LWAPGEPVGGHEVGASRHQLDPDRPRSEVRGSVGNGAVIAVTGDERGVMLVRTTYNTGNDWYFEDIVAGPDNTLEAYAERNRDRGIKQVVTVPMSGWVAKDAPPQGAPPRRAEPVYSGWRSPGPVAGFSATR
jgi:Glycoside hydrolase family 44